MRTPKKDGGKLVKCEDGKLGEYFTRCFSNAKNYDEASEKSKKKPWPWTSITESGNQDD